MSRSKLKGFTFYRSYLESIRGLPKEQKYAVIEAMMLYAFDSVDPDSQEIDPVVFALFCAFKPNLDNSISKALNGSKKRKRENQKPSEKKQTGSEKKQTASKDKDKDKGKDKEKGMENIDYADFLKRFNEATGKRFRVVCEKTKGHINARLKEGFAIDDIISAAKNCLLDEYHVKNPKYLTPEFITRSDKLQKFLNAGKDDQPEFRGF